MSRFVGRGAAAVLLAVLAGLSPATARAVESVASPVGSPAPDFLLHDQYGRPFRLSARGGRVVVLSFGYTLCPEACPMTLATWKRVEKSLGSEAKNVDFVYVTIDPKRDTEARLRERLAEFSTNFLGLTGAPAELEKAYRGYGVYREETAIPGSASDYVIGHGSETAVIDRRGRWRLELPYLSATGQGDELLAGVRKLLREP